MRQAQSKGNTMEYLCHLTDAELEALEEGRELSGEALDDE